METRWGKRLGRYEIVAELGRGAMGVVYKARDPKIDRFVAIKTIALSAYDAGQEPGYRERFFQEAQAAGRMFHPGIVTIFDVGEEPETRDPYIVMEYIGGQTLDNLLRGAHKKRLPVDKALQLVEELAEALDYAHAQGVVHRDIKPANVLVTEDGHAKIADFGIAKLNLSNLTLPGEALGTPAYMSPEQLAGEAVDARSDLFSLGVILYGTLTGYNPFQGNSAVTVCFKISNREPVRASALCPDLPPAVDAIIARAMAKNPGDRYQRGLEFALDLRELRKMCPRTNDVSPKWVDLTRTGTPIDHTKNAPAGFFPSILTEGTDSPTSAPQIQASTKVAPASEIEVPRAEPVAAAVQNALPGNIARKIPINLIAGAAAALLIVSLVGWRVTVAAHGRTTATSPVGSKPIAAVNAPAALPVAAPNHVVSPATLDAMLNPAADGAADNNAQGNPQIAAQDPGKQAGDINKSDSKKAKRLVAANLPAPRMKKAVPVTVAATPVPAPAAAVPQLSTLDIEIEHHFSEGDVRVWVDDKLAYTHALHGDGKQRIAFLPAAKAYESGTAQVPAGPHTLRVDVQSTADVYDQSQTISGTFVEGTPARLRITFEGHKKNIHLLLQ